LPVHNEAKSIESTIRETDEVLSRRVAPRFIVCEDGSVDETRQVLLRLSRTFPMKLVTGDQRKGYSRAMIDGMKAFEAEYLLCLDSDGQCDPKDFEKFWEVRDQQDVAIGRRVRRIDSLLRRTLSRGFYFVYQLCYRVPVHDPSCPFVLANRRVIVSLLPELGEMNQGFWWEFIARVHRRGFSLREITINHRSRSAGETHVYQLNRLAAIGYQHSLALLKVWFQTRKQARRPPDWRSQFPPEAGG
jgi:glycosyltransferase involved in cell wall biosynthesis